MIERREPSNVEKRHQATPVKFECGSQEVDSPEQNRPEEGNGMRGVIDGELIVSIFDAYKLLQESDAANKQDVGLPVLKSRERIGRVFISTYNEKPDRLEEQSSRSLAVIMASLESS